VLYPNPWPKIGHLARRWHGHAIFPSIVALGGTLECRSNWKIYVEEFALALTQLTQQPVQAELYQPEQTITPFEQKYLDSGHALWRCRTQLAIS
jgi:tRNA G46 methylase TrmB